MIFKFEDQKRNKNYPPIYLVTFNMEFDDKFDSWVLVKRFLRKPFYKHLGTFDSKKKASREINDYDSGI